MMIGYVPIPEEIAMMVYVIIAAVPLILISWMGISRFNNKKKDELRELVRTEKPLEMKTARWRHEYTVAYLGAAVLTSVTAFAALTVVMPSRGMDTAGEYIYFAAVFASVGSLVSFIGARCAVDAFLDSKLVKPLEEKAKEIIAKAAPALVGSLESQLDEMSDDRLFELTEMATATLKKRK